MKQKIDPSEIKPGDVIRWEAGESTHGPAHAVEYTASKSCLPWKLSGQHYLLERPEPPFEPYWGMIIKHPTEKTVYAIYLPDEDEYEGKQGIPWAYTETGEYMHDFKGNDWAKRKLAAGWGIIEKQGV